MVVDILVMQIIDQIVGIGVEVKFGDMVEVNYIGWLYDLKVLDYYGKKFDSLFDYGGIFIFLFGVGQVIKGWDQGVVGMKVGGKCILLLFLVMGYGSCGVGGDILLNVVLVFDVELVSIK